MFHASLETYRLLIHVVTSNIYATVKYLIEKTKFKKILVLSRQRIYLVIALILENTTVSNGQFKA